jgi:predicted phosphoribosyltransferase
MTHVSLLKSETGERHYVDRQDAGRRLAKALRYLKGGDARVIALPRGGIVLGAEIAKELQIPLDLVMVRKIGHPTYPEFAVGALVEDEPPVMESDELVYVDQDWLKDALLAAQALLHRRHRTYYGEDIQPLEVRNKTVVLVDDGIATGLTMIAAVKSMRHKGAKRVIVAVPVAPQDSVDTLEKLADEVVVLDDPAHFRGAVSAHYVHFDQVEDEEVAALLREAAYGIR